jgi:flagellar biosynthesis/type III secretory pathway protein FliH
VGLYAKLSGMRAVSSKTVIQRAEEVARKILDTYLEPDKSFVQLREMAIDGTIDLLRDFSDACRDEFAEMRPIQFRA